MLENSNLCAIATKIINAILETLGNPENDLHSKALAAFREGDYQTVKRLAATNLSDYYCKALGYLGGALKLTPNTDTILAESARAAADFVKEKTLARLGTEIAKASASMTISPELSALIDQLNCSNKVV